uniref:Uncharacterized protein n=1 Tax=Anopheles culicifacies TaxID=139723 RepID=A0A182LSS9_9DIPT
MDSSLNTSESSNEKEPVYRWNGTPASTEQPPMEWPTSSRLTDEDTERNLVSEDGLLSIAKWLKLQRAPGDENIPNVALTAAVKAFPSFFKRKFQHYITSFTAQTNGRVPKEAKGDPWLTLGIGLSVIQHWRVDDRFYRNIMI